MEPRMDRRRIRPSNISFSSVTAGRRRRPWLGRGHCLIPYKKKAIYEFEFPNLQIWIEWTCCKREHQIVKRAPLLLWPPFPVSRSDQDFAAGDTRRRPNEWTKWARRMNERRDATSPLMLISSSTSRSVLASCETSLGVTFFSRKFMYSIPGDGTK